MLTKTTDGNPNEKQQSYVKHFLIYGGGIILLNILPFVLIPIYTRGLTPQEFGALELLNRSQDFLLIIVSLGMSSSLATLFQFRKGDASGQKELYSTGLLCLAISGSSLIGLLLPLRNLLAEALLGERRLESAVAIVLIVTLLECLFQVAMLHLQSSLKSRMYVFFSLARMAVSISAAYILVTRLHLGLYGVLYASLVHTGSSAAVLCFLLVRVVGWHFSRETAVELLRFGVPLVPGAIAMFVLNNGDRYFMRIYCSREDIGIYGLAYRLGSMTNLIILTPFLKIWSVSMVEAANAEGGRQRLGKILTLLMSAVCSAGLALSLFSPYLLAVITPPKYWAASQYVPIVALAYVFFGSTIVLDAAFFTTKRTHFKSIILVASCAFVIPIYALLIKSWGVYGAAWATVSGFAFFSVLTLVFSIRVRPIDIELWKLFGLIAGAASTFLALRWITQPLTKTHFACSVVAILVFVIAIWRLPILDLRDKNELIRFLESYGVRFSKRLGGTEVAV